MTKDEKLFLFVFSVIVLLNLDYIYFGGLSILRYVVKPLIALSLISFVLWKGKTLQKSIRRLLLLGLIFSLIGDCLLMFDDHNPQYFLFGLVAFLMAHILYIVLFLPQRNPKQNKLPFIAILLIYAIGLFYVLKDGLGDMLIPVVIYILVISTMATTAFLRKDSVPNRSYKPVLLGAILFMISDSLLALDMFYKPIELANIGVILTYALAQFLIVIGILRQAKDKE